MSRKLAWIVCLLAAVPAAAYIPQTSDINGTLYALRWATSSFPIQWRMSLAVGSNVTGAREQADVFREAFDQWESISTAEVTFEEREPVNVKPQLDGLNVITTGVDAADFNSSALALTAAFSFPGLGTDPETGITAEFIGQIFDADIMFSPDRAFSTDPVTPAGIYDLEAVAVHEIGHLLGLDHSNILSSSMFPRILDGVSYARDTRLDDRIGVSTIYPAPSFAFSGSVRGTVRTTAGVPVFGALVVALDPNGQAAASAVTDPNGQYTIHGLSAGSYTVYAEPMNQPFQPGDAFTLSGSYPGHTVHSNFTVRYR